MTDDTPDWLDTMRAITGLSEVPGQGDNEKILGMAKSIAKAYPEMASYCAQYRHDATPWCGLCVAYCMTQAGVRPVFGETDTDKFLWARAWDDPRWGDVLDEPRPGCVVVMSRQGGGHVTLFESATGSSYHCRGGNQSDAVNVSTYPKSSVIALMWPRAGGPVPPGPRPELSRGDTGPAVAEVQTILGIPIDSMFGPVTEAGVKGFQAGWGLEVDGVVGPQSWEALDDLAAKVQAGSSGLTEETTQAIVALAEASALARYRWEDRGVAPSGYIAACACAYAVAVTQLANGGSAATVMAAGETGQPDTDALSFLKAQFEAMGWPNKQSGLPTLRHLWSLLIGLGMRESSGNHWEGRDMSASNVQADTCEAGLFQTSANIETASTELPKLFDEYRADPVGFLLIANAGVLPTESGLQNYGTGHGAEFQWLSKYSPAYACMVTAIGLRKRRKHWGPINKQAVELLPEADELLRAVEELLATAPPEPEPIPPVEGEVVNINITATPGVRIVVNGTDIGEVT
jgi:uncharacterized protein (TIGR02594 family)